MNDLIEGQQYGYPKWVSYLCIATGILGAVLTVERLMAQDFIYAALCPLLTLLSGFVYYSAHQKGIVVESDRIIELNPWPWKENKTLCYEEIRKAWYSPWEFRFSDGATEVSVMTGYQSAIQIAKHVVKRLPADVVHEGSDEMQHKVELGRDYTLREYAKSSAGVFLGVGVLAVATCAVSIVGILQEASPQREDGTGMFLALAVVLIISLWLTGVGIWGYLQRWSASVE
jgi:hypothetical protein